MQAVQTPNKQKPKKKHRPIPFCKKKTAKPDNHFTKKPKLT